MCIVTSRNKDSVSLTEIKSAHIIIGTSCAGTGLDTEVEYIIVVGLPFSIEQLLQWAGRCRIKGTVSVLVPSFHLKKDDELSGKDAIGIKICHRMDTICLLFYDCEKKPWPRVSESPVLH